MFLREYGPHWPPNVTIADAAMESEIPPKVDLSDVVVNVVKHRPGELRLRLRRSRYCEYTVMMPIPQSAKQQIILDIVRKGDITLRELGEVRIS